MVIRVKMARRAAVHRLRAGYSGGTRFGRDCVFETLTARRFEGAAMSRHALIIGGAGQIGSCAATSLLDAGWRVTLAGRGNKPLPQDLLARGAESVTFDRQQPGALAQAVKNGADAVIDMVAYDDSHARQLLEIQSDVGAFVVISSASVYCDDQGRALETAAKTGIPKFAGAVKESQATVDPGPETYSSRKSALERELLDHATKPVAILRPAAIHGLYSTQPREWWVVKRMLDGRTVIPLAYKGESRFHTSAAVGIGALIAAALEKPATQVLNAADPYAPTAQEICTTIAKHMGWEGAILPLDIGDEIGAAPIGKSPWSLPAPYVLNTDAAQALTPLPTYEATVGASCDWLRDLNPTDWRKAFPVLAMYPGDIFDYAAEDAALSR
jgi:nucleoside-diphosphate-sugar epimerase